MTITGTDILKNGIANQVADPCTLVIFGANGDLTKRLLIPALCNLAGRKHLPKNFAIIGTGQVVIQFKDDRLTDFGDIPTKNLTPNTLVLKIQPDEGICLQFGAKVPGEVLSIQMLAMDCKYSDYFGQQTTNGYETLLYDCLIGDCLLFARADNVETNWGIVDPILKYWQNAAPDTLQVYSSGASGPIAADKLLGRDGRKWQKLSK